MNGKIDLSALPRRELIAPKTLAELTTELKSSLIDQIPALAPGLSLESTLESQLIQWLALVIYQQREQANDWANSLMLAHATGQQLDHLGNLPWLNTARKELVSADPAQQRAAVYETDEVYRHRLQQALEGFTTAGSVGAYRHHARAAHPAVQDVSVAAPSFIAWQPETGQSGIPADWPNDVQLIRVKDDAGLTDPMPGDVAIWLNGSAPGAISADVVSTVLNALNAALIRPLNDRPRAQAATSLTYTIEAGLWFYPGPDEAVTLAAAREQTEHYIRAHYQLGHDITRSGLTAALHQPGVQKVDLIRPATDLVLTDREAAWCDQITLHNRGRAT